MPAKAHRDFKIFPSFHGRPLGDVLLILLHRVPAWEVERLLAGRHVHVDGNVCTDPARRLPSGAIVRVFEHEQAADATRGDVRIVHVDDDLVIVDKPAGMTATRHRDDDTNAERKDRSPTVEDLLPGLIIEWERSKAFGAAVREEADGRRSTVDGGEGRGDARHYNRGSGRASPTGGRDDGGGSRREGRSPDRGSRSAGERGRSNSRDRGGKPGGRDARRPADARFSAPPRRDERESNLAPAAPPRPTVIAVHRIDRDTSGLMVFARNKPTADSLLHQFARRSIDRVYHAVALGEVRAMRCDSYFVRDRGDGKRGSKSRRATAITAATTEIVPSVDDVEEILDGDDDLSTATQDEGAEAAAPITPIAGILRPGTRKAANSSATDVPSDKARSSPPVRPSDEEAQRAVTHISPIRTITNTGLLFTMVECRLESGRTHQIRIHLAEAGHPICGDRVYRGAMEAPQIDPVPAPRQALHAAELGFDHPRTGKRVVYRATWPGDLRRWLDGLEKPRRR